MNNKVKLLLITGLMAAGVGVACAQVQFKLDQSKIGPDGGIISYSVNVLDQNNLVIRRRVKRRWPHLIWWLTFLTRL